MQAYVVGGENEDWRELYMKLQDSAIELEDELADTKEELRMALNEIAGLRERLNVSKEVINTQSWQVEYMRAQLDEAPRDEY